MIRCVGIMLLMSMLTMPQLTAEAISRRYRDMMWISVAVSLLTSAGGLLLTTAVNVPPRPSSSFCRWLSTLWYAFFHHPLNMADRLLPSDGR